jgi:hypothetical protein
MNHQPFEDWLLADEFLTLQQQRQLQDHLRGCTACSGIADSNLALHATRMIAPAPGFTDRFRPRLAAWQREQIRRQAVGTILLVAIGMGLLYVLAGPALLAALQSPAAWLGRITGLFIEVLTLARVFSQIGSVLLRHVPAILPGSLGPASVVATAGLALIWTFMMRRLARAPQGA